MHYNPLVNETKLVVYYDIQDISSPTTICTNYDSSIKSIEVDGTLLDSVVTTYQFDSVGEHIIKYEFNNSTVGNGSPLFNNLTTIKRAVIADTFTSIGDNAFVNCTSLQSVIIPNSVTSIGYNTFNNCTSLTSVIIPNSVTSVGINTFVNCTSLQSVIIPNSVTSIGSSVFEHCTSLTNITIPDSVTSIGNRAFDNCSGLTSITIGSNVTSIGQAVFFGCTSLTSVTSLATTAPSINYDTFQNVKTGGTLTVPQGSTGYDVWMDTSNYYLGLYNWTKVEQ